jgi:hypothetical protein
VEKYGEDARKYSEYLPANGVLPEQIMKAIDTQEYVDMLKAHGAVENTVSFIIGNVIGGTAGNFFICLSILIPKTFSAIIGETPALSSVNSVIPDLPPASMMSFAEVSEVSAKKEQLKSKAFAGLQVELLQRKSRELVKIAFGDKECNISK